MADGKNSAGKLEARLVKLEELAETTRRALWLATVLGLSVGGAVGFLWARFESANGKITTMQERVSVVESSATKLEALLDPTSVQTQARRALQDSAPAVIKDTLDSIRREIPTHIQVMPPSDYGYGPSGGFASCEKPGEVVVGVGSGNNQNNRVRCAKIDIAK